MPAALGAWMRRPRALACSCVLLSRLRASRSGPGRSRGCASELDKTPRSRLWRRAGQRDCAGARLGVEAKRQAQGRGQAHGPSLPREKPAFSLDLGSPDRAAIVVSLAQR